MEGINVFKGIPYGGTTAGKNRFMPPGKPAAWTGQQRLHWQTRAILVRGLHSPELDGLRLDGAVFTTGSSLSKSRLLPGST